jgi:endonuclease YncB( thermonuclease family)
MRLTREFRLVAALFLFALGAGLVAFPSPPAALGEPSNAAKSSRAHERGEAAHLRVIDGDTLEDMATNITYRVVNIDTPETGPRARCRAERKLGNRATRQARALISSAGSVELRPTGRVDRYGRTVAFVLIDGRDLGETLIGEGLARRWRGRGERWCGANGGLSR